MINVEVTLSPMPADDTLFQDDVQYLAVDKDGQYHIARWNGESFTVGGPDDEGDAEDDEDLELSMIGALPDIEVPDSI